MFFLNNFFLTEVKFFSDTSLTKLKIFRSFYEYMNFFKLLSLNFPKVYNRFFTLFKYCQRSVKNFINESTEQESPGKISF